VTFLCKRASSVPRSFRAMSDSTLSNAMPIMAETGLNGSCDQGKGLGEVADVFGRVRSKSGKRLVVCVQSAFLRA
jgi:hypothetical protein